MPPIIYIAQYIANVLHAHGYEDVSPMKLQKVLYYTKVWGLVDGTPWVDASFLKWKHGPVNKKVWEHYYNCGYQGRNAVIERQWIPQGAVPEAGKKLAEFVVDSYGPLGALTLSAMTHREAPWQQTPDNEVIPDDLIYGYYSAQPFAQNFPLDFEGKPYYALPTDGDAAFTMDMSKHEAEQFRVYASFNAYRKYLSQVRGELDDNWLSRLLA
ncbi:MAG: type II toxin-antitoxin system antitoxin SocA domain-containing protein [Bacteroidota bacterium]